MTETTLLPGTAPDQTAIEAPVEFDQSNGGDRRRLMALGAGAGVVVIAAAAYFLVFHKSSTADSGPVTIPGRHVGVGALAHGVTTPAVAAGRSVGTPGTKLPKPAKHVSAGRDPFKALVVAPATGGSQAGPTTQVAGQTSAQASTPAAPSGTTASTTPVVVTPPSSNPGSGPQTGGGTTGAPQYIQLMSTKGERSATFKVGYADHRFRRFVVHAPKATSTRGTVFDGEFALIGIQDGQVTLQVGDATPFDLSRGIARTV